MMDGGGRVGRKGSQIREGRSSRIRRMPREPLLYTQQGRAETAGERSDKPVQYCIYHGDYFTNQFPRFTKGVEETDSMSKRCTSIIEIVGLVGGIDEAVEGITF